MGWDFDCDEDEELLKKSPKRRLTKLDVREVSIVDRPANKVPFLIVKREGDSDMDGLLELIEDGDGMFDVIEVTDRSTEQLDELTKQADEFLATLNEDETTKSDDSDEDVEKSKDEKYPEEKAGEMEEDEEEEAAKQEMDEEEEEEDEDGEEAMKSDKTSKQDSLTLPGSVKSGIQRKLTGALQQMMGLLNVVRSAKSTDEESENPLPAEAGRAINKIIDDLKSIDERYPSKTTKFDLFYNPEISKQELSIPAPVKSAVTRMLAEGVERTMGILNAVKSAETGEEDQDVKKVTTMVKGLLSVVEGIKSRYPSPVNKSTETINKSVKAEALAKTSELLYDLTGLLNAIKNLPESEEAEAKLPSGASVALAKIAEGVKDVAENFTEVTKSEDGKLGGLADVFGPINSQLAGISAKEKTNDETEDKTTKTTESDDGEVSDQIGELTDKFDKFMENNAAVSEAIKSFKDDVHEGFEKCASVLASMAKQVETMQERVAKVENLSGTRQGGGSEITEEVSDVSAEEPVSKRNGNIWSGMFDNAIAQAKARR